MFRAQKRRVESAFENGEFFLPEEAGRATRQDGEEPRQLTASEVFSLTAAIEEVRSVFAEQVPDIIEAGFETLTERLGADTSFDASDPEVQEAVEELNEKAQGIAETTRNRINTAITAGVEDGKSVADIRDDVTELLEEMAEGDEDQQPRARRIASTTTTTAFEKGQQRSMEKASVFGGMWLSQRDVHVRSGHLAADGQTVSAGEPFEVACRAGGSTEELRFPGDPTGRPCNVINCRCTVLPVPDQETFEQMQDEEPDLSNLPQLSDTDG